MALTPADADRLVRLRAKRDAAIGGEQVTKIATAGRSMELTPADLDRLDGEISALEAAAASPTGRVRRRGALTFRFRS